MKILLIGGTGVLSSAVTDVALNRGIKVTMINRGRRRIPEGVELLKFDNKKYNCIREAIKGRRFDAVIDFLCYNKKELEDSFRLYSEFTQQYFFISSCSVYDTSISGTKDEGAPKETKDWPYSVDKWECEKLLSVLAKDSECSYTIVRPCLTYGNTRIPYGVTPRMGMHWTLVARLLAGKPIVRWNKGENRWNVMRVEDFAVGLVGLIGKDEALGEAFNICGDETPSYAEILDCVGEAVGTVPKVCDLTAEEYARGVSNRRLAGEIVGGRGRDLICSNAKIKHVVPEFRHRIGLLDGLRKTIQAYRDEQYQLGIDWTYDAQQDRIISNLLSRGASACGARLGFVDYLGMANIHDKCEYYGERYRGSLFGKGCHYFLRAIEKFG